MKTVEYATNILEFAQQFFWNLSPEEAIEDKSYFLAHLMAHAPRDVYGHVCTCFGFTKDDFIAALKDAPPGLFTTEEKWNYWNNFLEITPSMPMPFMRPGWDNRMIPTSQSMFLR